MAIIKNDSKEDMTEGMDGEMDEMTALIPMSLLMGKKVSPGDTVMLDVIHVYDDEVEVKYHTKKKEKAEDGMSDDTNDTMREAEDHLEGLAGDGY